MSKRDNQSNQKHHKHTIWDHMKPNTLTRVLAWIAVIVVALSIYTVWDSYQTPASVHGCEKSTFPDGEGTLWRCPKGVN